MGHRDGNIGIRRYRAGDATAAAGVIHATFARFNRDEGTAQAVARYLQWHDPRQPPEALRRYFARTPVFFVATHGRKLARRR